MKIQICIILLTITIHQIYAKSQQKDENLIETTCKNTPNYKLCIDTLRSSSGSATADVAGLGLIMVEAVKSKTEQALSIVNYLAQPKLAQPLRKCTKFYYAVLMADVPMAEAALRKGDPKFADNGMADAAFEAELCDGAFKGVGAPSSVTAVNKDIRELAVIARAVIKNLL